ncbi:hypothetical protein ACTJJ8_04525 [Agrobacterium radiobacter]|uniref:hypothetical protein n=1 Tax=Agrobacterium tumefaciens complex TaxID=1183400 RepID=UPI0021CFB85C|nr:hypothetical protein [Agrobacterium tumefaciens]UXT96525.1 hypothetical protein FY129_03265 [Agrobacterium tumefaciens]
MQDFKASTQYGDWQGTAQADDGSQVYFQNFLREKGVIDENSYAVGIRFFNGETFDKPWIKAVVADGAGYDDVNAQITSTGTLRFKEVDINLTLQEFFELFKRFSIILTSRDLGLAEREYEVIEEQ